MQQTFTELLGGAALFGVAGWGLENALSETPRYSQMFGGVKAPFLPVYAAGGAGVMMLAPTLRAQNLPWPVRGAIYAGAMSGVELVACYLDRGTFGAKSWDYKDGGFGGCLDWKHALAWGALGLLAEQFVPKAKPLPPAPPVVLAVPVAPVGPGLAR